MAKSIFRQNFYKKNMNNNKGFNWFFPIALIAILFFFFSNMNGDSKSNTIDEEAFYKLMQEGKVKDILIYKDTEKADVFLTKAANAELTKTKGAAERSPFQMLDLSPKPDYNLSYGDLQLFLQKFDQIKQDNPALATKKDFGQGKNPLTELLFTALFWIGIMALFYFVIFRKMMGGGGGGPGGQIFSIGKSKAKLFDEKDKVQTTFKDVAGL